MDVPELLRGGPPRDRVPGPARPRGARARPLPEGRGGVEAQVVGPSV